MQQKIGIFSKGSANPLHPRIELEINVLKKSGYDVQLFTPTKNKITFKSRLLNLLSLSLFEWKIIDEYKDFVKNFSTVIIYDSQLLPLVKEKTKNQKVIFETLDDNVELIVYHVFKKLPLFAFLKPLCRIYLKNREQFYLNNYVDKVIVNSARLKQVFKKQNTLLNYYSSPFEGINLNHSALSSSLLYLGKISFDKGALAMIQLSIDQNIPLYLYGDFEKTEKRELSTLISQYEHIHHHEKCSIVDLQIKLIELSKQYRLIGLSLIESVHISYKFQDANKDIDYIALGIPFIGNDRPTTKKILDSGCGSLINHTADIEKIIKDVAHFQLLSNNCRKHYKNNFSQAIFSKNLLDVIA